MGLARSSKQYLGVRAILPPDLRTATRAPTSSDKAYVKGTLWLDTASSAAYMWPGSGNWISLGTSTTAAINTKAAANSAGTVTLVGGTATVEATSVTANSLIRLYRQSVGKTGAAPIGHISRGAIKDGVSFVINSVSADNAKALVDTDGSVVFWEIVN